MTTTTDKVPPVLCDSDRLIAYREALRRFEEENAPAAGEILSTASKPKMRCISPGPR